MLAHLIATVPVTLTVTDDDGMSATCVSNVTVRDLIAPMPVCASNIEVQLSATDGTYMLLASDLDGATVDNCVDGYTASIDPITFNCGDAGTAPNIILTVTDQSGNDNTESCVVNILDPDPVANCIVSPLDVTLDANGAASIDATDIDDGSSDFCTGTSGLTYTLSGNTAYDCDDVGTPQTVTLTVDDSTAGGSSSTCTTTVNVLPGAPVAQCVAPFDVILDANGDATITAAMIDDASSDSCGEATFALSAASPFVFDCTDDGLTYSVTLEVSYNGTTSTCTTDVSVMKDPTEICSCVPDHRVESQNPVLTGYYPANLTVMSAGTVNPGADVHFKGGESVTLLPGFTVGLTAKFLADIGPCDPE